MEVLTKTIIVPIRILGGFLVVWFGALFVVFNKSHTLICFLLHRSQCSSSNVFFSSKVPTYWILTGTCTETNQLRRISIIIKKKRLISSQTQVSPFRYFYFLFKCILLSSKFKQRTEIRISRDILWVERGFWIVVDMLFCNCF